MQDLGNDMGAVSTVEAAAANRSCPPRSYLFLQGPISDFFDRLGRALIARGHRVHRINLHFGDQLFWRLPAAHYRGSFEDFRAFVAAEIERHQVTHLVLHGDRRPYHIVAAEEARARGIPVLATDLGYVRPDWITLEHDGLTTYSRFPHDPETIGDLAERFAEPDLRRLFHTPFWLIAVLDVLYNLALVFGRPLYPRYRYHSIVHPFVEYAGWLWSRTQELFTKRRTALALQRLAAAPGSYFLVPLQLATDYQIRAHSPYRDLREAVREIIASFAASGSRRQLVFLAHPLDNGLIGWPRLVARAAGQCGIPGQAFALPGGTPPELLAKAAGIVTVNSTVGVAALQQGVPLKALGNAVFDVPGLTGQSSLAAFWHDPPPPDPQLMQAFLRALVGSTQVKGGYYKHASQDCAIAGFVERLERGLYPLPPLTAAEQTARVPCEPLQTLVVAGLSGRLQAAVARCVAEPGVRVGLIDGDRQLVERLADDCRRRGVAVARCGDAGGGATSAAFLATLARGTSVELLAVPAVIPQAGNAGDAAALPHPAAAIIETMRKRRRGELVLVGEPVGQPMSGEAAAARRSAAACIGYAALLRRQLRADNVWVTVVVPSGSAIRVAAWLNAPQLTVEAADRIAARIVRRRRRRRPVIAVPGATVVASRSLRVLTVRLRNALRTALAPRLATIGEAADEAPVGGSGAGD